MFDILPTEIKKLIYSYTYKYKYKDKFDLIIKRFKEQKVCRVYKNEFIYYKSLTDCYQYIDKPHFLTFSDHKCH